MPKAKSTQTFQKTTLDNGVRLILVPQKGVNSVASAVMVAVGSRYERPEISGISHFLEHMVFKGTEKYPTTEDVNAIERQGGLQNAYTDIDITNYHNKVLATDWELGLEINKELALKPRLEQQYVDKERDVILEEMKRYDDEPAAKADETLHTTMYAGTKLGMRTIGEVESLKTTDATTLRAYHSKWYSPSQLVVVVAGRIMNNELRIMEKANQWFGGLKKVDVEPVDRVAEKQEKPELVVVTKPDAQQAHWVMGFRTFARGSEDRFAWNVFNLLMGVSFTSRLFKEIREKRGLCYHIRSSSSNWTDVGNWTIYAGVATAKVEEAISSTLEQVALARDRGVTAEEVAVAQKRLKTIIAFKSEDPEFLNEYYGRQETFKEPIMSLEEYLDKINNVTKQQINELTKKYFTKNNLSLALVWNKPREEKLQDLLHL